MKVKSKSGLRTSLLRITVLPLTLLGIIIIAYSSYHLTARVHQEVKTQLKDVARSAVYTYEREYPGDYRKGDDGNLYKGLKQVEDAEEILEGYKRMFDVDVTIFYCDERVATTIRSDSGNPIVGTKANEDVTEDVFHGRAEMFYENTNINNNRYFSYYRPLYDTQGNCTGMLFAGKEVRYVRSSVLVGVMPVLIAMFVCVAIVVFVIWAYANKLIKSMWQLGDFFVKVEGGDLTTELGPEVMKRKDELGRIGKSAVQMQSALRELIERDSLTGLYNRHYGEIWLREARKEAKESGCSYHVAIGDIDFFKKFNDSYGHDCGDMVLREVSRTLKKGVGENGYAARWGGEEFLLVLSGKKIEDVEGFVKRIAEDIKTMESVYEDRVLKVTMTFGVTDGDAQENIDDVIKKADQALYEGKETGRDKVVYKH